MCYGYLSLVAINIFPVSEIILAIKRRTKAGEGIGEDQDSLKTIWKSVVAGIVLATAFRFIVKLPLPLSVATRDILTSVLVIGGMGIRWMAIATLGKHFTVNLAVLENHNLISSGLYKYIRHPSYTGLLISFFGCGLSTNNLVSIVLLMVPICWAICKRIRIEEAMLRGTFREYADYQKKTWEIIPLIW